MKNQEKMQEKYLQMHMIDQQMKQLQQNMAAFEKQVEDMALVEESLRDLKNVKEGSEILVPLSSGIFVKAKIGDTNEYLVNVGSSVSVKKKGEDVIALIHEQQVEIQKIILEAAGQLEALARQAQDLQEEINALLK